MAGLSGWHPHLHVLFFIDEPMNDFDREDEYREFRRRMRERWIRRLGEKHGRNVSEEFGTRFDPVKADESDKIGVYCTKVGYELAMADSKIGRSEGQRHPFAIAHDAANDGDKADVMLLREWIASSKGKRSIQWSGDQVKAYAKGEAERSDQDLLQSRRTATHRPTAPRRVHRQGCLMAARRSAGEGSIFQAADGRWTVMLDLGRRPDGRRRRIKRRARTRAEAQRKLRELRSMQEDLGDGAFAGRTVGAMLDDFAELRAAEGRSRKVAERDELADQLIRAFFGESTRVLDVSVSQCDAFLAGVVNGSVARSGRPVSRDYGNRFRSYLQRAFVNEIRRGYLRHSPAQFAIVPASSVKGRKLRALSKAEWLRLHEIATGSTRLAVDLSGRHGLRPQEARSIRWADVDLNGLTISVVNQFDADNEFVDTKTEGARRTILLHRQAADILADWQAQQSNLRSDAGASWQDRDLVLTTRHGTAINQSNYRRSLKALCQKAGVDPVTPYELRHSAISHQIDAGHGATQVADWAGTSERMIHLHYRHRLRQVQQLSPTDYGDGQ